MGLIENGPRGALHSLLLRAVQQHEHVIYEVDRIAFREEFSGALLELCEKVAEAAKRFLQVLFPAAGGWMRFHGKIFLTVALRSFHSLNVST
jgi:hypothetical protein